MTFMDFPMQTFENLPFRGISRPSLMTKDFQSRTDPDRFKKTSAMGLFTRQLMAPPSSAAGRLLAARPGEKQRMRKPPGKVNKKGKHGILRDSIQLKVKRKIRYGMFHRIQTAS